MGQTQVRYLSVFQIYLFIVHWLYCLMWLKAFKSVFVTSFNTEADMPQSPRNVLDLSHFLLMYQLTFYQLGPFGNIWDHFWPFLTIWYHVRPFGTIWDHLKPLKKILNHLGPFGTIKEHSRPFGNIWLFTKVFHQNITCWIYFLASEFLNL